MDGSDEFELFLHNEKHIVRGSELSPETTLNQYLRNNMFLTGTKVMCREGGCGSCIVAATAKDPFTNKDVTFAVNSCLVSIFSCSGWKISTVEGIGNIKMGYHPIQTNLAKFNGTQCGFCSPGMVMNMYALYEQGQLTMKEIENSFGGNMCRCTGYRPILAAMKSMATDLTVENLGIIPDIEDELKCLGYKENCQKTCPIPCIRKEANSFALSEGSKWYKVYTIQEILDVFKTNPNKSYKLVSGNTAKGVYYDMGDAVDCYIDVQYVKELLGHQMNTNDLVLGANMSLEHTMQLFYTIHKNDVNFSYLETLADHIDLVATVPVRNIGSIAGNLSIKHAHMDFPSDIFLLLESVGATLTIVDINRKETKLKVADYLLFNMDKKIIKSVTLPSLNASYKFNSFKIMPRAQNAHAMVNGAFLVKFKTNNIVQSASICFGGINPQFTHARNTEQYLIGKPLFDNTTLQGAYAALNNELVPNHVLPDPKPEFRKKLAISLFYKYILSIAPNVSEKFKTGGQKLMRPLSKGTQVFDTNESMYPISKAINKLEAIAQTSGAAEYIQDMPDHPHQHFAAFILANAPANSEILKINPEEALKVPGVVAFVGKDDIPGINSYLPLETNFVENEEIFCSSIVKFYHQPLGLIVATTQQAAEVGAAKVIVTYKSSNVRPYLYIRDVLAAPENIKNAKLKHENTIVPKTKGTDIKKTLSGTYDTTWQYHYHMETQCCNVVPLEDGFDVFPSTQWMDMAQTAGAVCLKIDISKINVKVRRVGGAYGGKISRNNLISCAALVASNKLNKPIKLWMPFITNMDSIGKRNPISADYTVKVNDKGVIQELLHSYYTDLGVAANELPISMSQALFNEQYISDTFQVEVYTVKTDNHAATWTRAPGSLEGLSMIESIMEHIAYEVKLDPLEVRLANLNAEKHPKLAEFIQDVRNWADLDKRKKDIDSFNKANRWRKRGISVVPMAYDLYFEGNFPALISIYQGDGSVAVSHGGIEMGQGINTKAAQVVAYTLGIDMSLISMKPSNSLVGANSYVTGGSITSEGVCMALQTICEELNTRIKPIKDKNPTATWPELIKQCFYTKVNLMASNMWGVGAENFNYVIYGVTAAEVELDVLTGNSIITRVDLLEDTGTSMSPFIDIGQVEGAFVMGIGFWTTEEYIMAQSGEVMTNRTWTYKPPGAKDIPVEFNVKFPLNNPNKLSPFKTKATAEPPLCMSVVIPLALKQAVKAARLDADATKPSWYAINGPATVEQNFMSCLSNYKQYTL